MDSIRIQGGVALQGKVRVQGSKNASLPILAATLLVEETSYIRNCPKIADVYSMVSLLKSLGCSVCWQETGIAVDTSRMREERIPVTASWDSSPSRIWLVSTAIFEKFKENPRMYRKKYTFTP